jgi:hypothetical protein
MTLLSLSSNSTIVAAIPFRTGIRSLLQEAWEALAGILSTEEAHATALHCRPGLAPKHSEADEEGGEKGGEAFNLSDQATSIAVARRRRRWPAFWVGIGPIHTRTAPP